MADFQSVTLSVGVTITLQSLYLAGIKFPRNLKIETNALQSAARFNQEYLNESSVARNLADSAISMCSEANDLLLQRSKIADRDKLIWDLNIVGSKLDGCSSCREPEASYLRIISRGVQRTISLLRDNSLSEQQIRLEVMSIAQTAQASLKTMAYRANEDHLKLADGLEERATSLDMSLLEFMFASALSYLGILAISAWILSKAVFLTSSHGWLKISIWLLISALMSPVMVLFKKLGDSARKMIEATETHVNATRDSLLRLT